MTHDDGLQICELVRRRTSTKKAMELEIALPEYRTTKMHGPIADLSIMFRQESFDIVMATEPLNRLQDFFTTTESLNHHVMQQWLTQRLQIEALRSATFENISSTLLSRKRFRLDINAAAPRLLIPEKYHQEDRESCVLIVADLGRLGVLSSPAENSLYDSIHVRSEKIRVVVMRTRGGDSWRVYVVFERGVREYHSNITKT